MLLLSSFLLRRKVLNGNVHVHGKHFHSFSSSASLKKLFNLSTPLLSSFFSTISKINSSEVNSNHSIFLQDDYELMSKLGQGSSSQVFQGYNVLTNQKQVVKIFKLISEKDIQKEININNKINQIYNQKYKGKGKGKDQKIANIDKNQSETNIKSSFEQQSFPLVRLLSHVRNKGCGGYSFIFQFNHGSPMNYIPPPVLLENRYFYMKQILQGLRLLHAEGIIHRDMKPSNILITPNRGAKIFDFGLSKIKAIDNTIVTKRFGTKCYYPPEVVFRMESYDEKIDIWSTGVIFAELMTDKKPIIPYKTDLKILQQVMNLSEYDEEKDGHLIRQELRKQKVLPEKINKHKSFKALYRKSIEAKLFPKEYEKALIEQEKQVVNVIRKMLSFNPADRPSAEQILLKLQKFFIQNEKRILTKN